MTTQYGFRLVVPKRRHPADNTTLAFMHRYCMDSAKSVGAIGYEVVEIREGRYDVSAIVRAIFAEGGD